MQRFFLFFKISLLFFLFSLSLNSCQKAPADNVKTSEKATYELVWADEFETDGLPDSTKWSYDYGTGCPEKCGWGNNEKQFYTRNRLENARIEDGHLLIEARKEAFEGQQYTSARLVTKEKGDWLYGKIEARVKLPKGKGTWPAVWLLSTDWEYGGWPESGEIDLMEHVGYNPDKIFGTIHTKAYNHGIGTQKGDSTVLADAETAFHTYAIEWTKDAMEWFIDGKSYYKVQNEGKTWAEWPFDKRFHVILNLAIGGNWGGKMGIDDAILPQRMVVDYVRVYQMKSEE